MNRMNWLGGAGIVVLCAGLSMAETYPMVEAKAGWDTLPALTVRSGDWPWWRGQNRDNCVVSATPVPTAWSETRNVKWKTALPGEGHSTPIFIQDRIYLTSCDKTENVLWMLALERSSGRLLWKKELARGPWGKLHKDNNYASATLACDGERIFVPFQNPETLGMLATDLDGKIIWKQFIFNYGCAWGVSTSPLLYKSAVIFPVEGSQGSCFVALNRATGAVIYRRPSLRKVKESYATPTVMTVNGRDQFVMAGGEAARGIDTMTGDLIWECKGPADYNVATPVMYSNIVYVTGGYPQRTFLAIRADGTGDVTDSARVLWKGDAKAGYVPSPVLVEGVIYAVNDKGLFRVYDALTGKIFWEHDLNAPFYSSPIWVNKQIYLFDRKGNGYVIPAATTKGTITTNTLGSAVCASPVALDGKLYVRTATELYCIAQ